jgi:ubiquinone/menaquinone biosynthesis C-methylase UbiE
MAEVSDIKRDFNKEATSWDKEPRRLKMANDIANAISGEIKLNQMMDILDFGCGTGLLSLNLYPFVRSVTGVDNSHGMLDVFKAKIENQGLTNVKAKYLDLEKGDELEGSYHLVVSSMTLHHIREIGPLLERFHRVTAPGGHLCIADLDPDDGLFHDSNEGVFHFGFDRPMMSGAFMKAGFSDIRSRTAAEIIKPVPSGGTRSFTVFLVAGRKIEKIRRGP